MNLPKPKKESTKTILKQIAVCWIFGFTMGYLPLVWNKDTIKICRLAYVLSESYIIFRFIMVILIPSIILILVYLSIYRIIIIGVKNFNLNCKSVVANIFGLAINFDPRFLLKISSLHQECCESLIGNHYCKFFN